MDDRNIFDDLLEEPEPIFDENNDFMSQPHNELSLEPEEMDNQGDVLDNAEDDDQIGEVVSGRHPASGLDDGSEEFKNGGVENEEEAEDEQEEEGEVEQEEGEEEQLEEVEEEGEEEIEEQVADQDQQVKAKPDHGLFSFSEDGSGDDDKSSSNQENDSEMPPKRRGRPSKKDKERDMERQQTKLQKRVRFENGGEKVIYKSDAESDEAQNGFGVKSGEQAGAEDLDTRKNPGDFDEYVKMMSDEPISTNFETFTFRRRKQVYENLNEEEQRRFTNFIEACSKKPMKKKLLDLIAQLPGQKLKIDEVATQVINSAVKSHAGQLIELAKKIQIDEIKQRLALKFPHRALQKDGRGPIIEEKRFLINGQCLSRQAQDALGQEIKEMGAILPHHLQEARRQLNQSTAGVSDRPKSMFLNKRFR